MVLAQNNFDVRCEWGRRGLQELAPVSDVLILVDVLSFTTSVDIATSRGAVIFPYPSKDQSVAEYAATVGAETASGDRRNGFSLSPASLLAIPAGYRLVLPSPNGAALAFGISHPVVLAACLRNASAVARMAARRGLTFAVIPAGETWDSGELRPGVEDLIGAGAVIDALPGKRSPEAEMAADAFLRFREDLAGALRDCSSGTELIARGFTDDLNLAGAHDVSASVPQLRGGAFASA